LPEFLINATLPGYCVIDRLEFIFAPPAEQVIQIIIFPRIILSLLKPEARLDQLNGQLIDAFALLFGRRF